LIRKLYDLAAADETIRFSPYCWRTKLALAHKNLSFESIPWHFTEKAEIAVSGQTKVPVLVDGANIIHDSQTIAEYLETNYPNEASLFGDATSRALTHFIKQWTDTTLHPAIAKIVLPDIFNILAPKDKAYFRETRERFLGTTIEALDAQREAHLPAFQAALAPLRHCLKLQPFIAGIAPAYADHIVFGALKWATTTSATALLAPDDPITLWMASILATYGYQGSSWSQSLFFARGHPTNPTRDTK
jgi:glutathione S-transferase